MARTQVSCKEVVKSFAWRLAGLAYCTPEGVHSSHQAKGDLTWLTQKSKSFKMRSTSWKLHTRRSTVFQEASDSLVEFQSCKTSWMRPRQDSHLTISENGAFDNGAQLSTIP